MTTTPTGSPGDDQTATPTASPAASPPVADHPVPDQPAGDQPAAGQLSSEDQSSEDQLSATVRAAFEVGWTMATLYNPPAPFGAQGVDHLPTVDELSTYYRSCVELDRLECLFESFVPATAGVNLSKAKAVFDTMKAAWDAETVPQTALQNLHEALPHLNFLILGDLACAPNEVELAYEAGRALRDTANFPPKSESPASASVSGGSVGFTDDELGSVCSAYLGQKRTSTLQQWLQTLAPHFPPQTATVVSTSLGRWSVFVGAALDPTQPGQVRTDKNEFSNEMTSYLRRQGDVWLQLLTGTRSTASMLDPEGYVAAGDLALRRSTRILLSIIRHRWIALAVVAAALGFVLWLSAAYLGGATKVWTSIAAIAASFGVTAQGIGSAAGRMARTAGRSLFGLEEDDVMAWVVTSLPPARLDRAGVRTVRRAGIGPSRRLKNGAPSDGTPPVTIR
jgi:hypothetical protein